jgi:hypothetical protein
MYRSPPPFLSSPWIPMLFNRTSTDPYHRLFTIQGPAVVLLLDVAVLEAFDFPSGIIVRSFKIIPVDLSLSNF